MLHLKTRFTFPGSTYLTGSRSEPETLFRLFNSTKSFVLIIAGRVVSKKQWALIYCTTEHRFLIISDPNRFHYWLWRINMFGTNRKVIGERWFELHRIDLDKNCLIKWKATNYCNYRDEGVDHLTARVYLSSIRICKTYKKPRNRFPSLANSILWKRFLGYLNVYKYGLWILLFKRLVMINKK